MLAIFKTCPEGLVEIDIEKDEIESGSWFNLIRPTAHELRLVSEITQVELDALRAALDQEEASRIEAEDEYILVLTNIPKKGEENPYGNDTIPLGIIVTPKFIITVCLEENGVLSDFNPMHHRFFSTYKRTRFLFQILYRTSMMFLKDLRSMNRRTDDIEQALRKSMKNEELFQLLDMQKGLTYFTVALRSNRSVIERLMRFCSNPQVSHMIKLREEDEELLEDVRIEYDQAIEMVQMHGDVLASMMDAFASVISNNLNMVMKFLASVTIVMAIPTMIASFFGMNVPVPWQGEGLGFLFVFMISSMLTLVVTIIKKKKRMF